MKAWTAEAVIRHKVINKLIDRAVACIDMMVLEGFTTQVKHKEVGDKITDIIKLTLHIYCKDERQDAPFIEKMKKAVPISHKLHGINIKRKEENLELTLTIVNSGIDPNQITLSDEEAEGIEINDEGIKPIRGKDGKFKKR